MKPQRLLWQMYIPMVLTIVISIAGSTWYAVQAIEDFFITQIKADLLTRAGLVRSRIGSTFAAEEYARLNDLCRTIGNETATRITVIKASGGVVADSMENPAIMNNHAHRPEVISSLAGQTGISIRHSNTLGQKMLYLAIPLPIPAPGTTGSAVQGVLRLSIPITAIDQATDTLVSKILLSSLVLVLAAALITLSVSRKIARPLETIRNYAELLSRGDLARPMPRDPGTMSFEVAQLAAAMDSMARQLNERFQTVTRQRNELEAVFASMVEAVLVINWNQKILSINTAAMNLLGLSPEDRGRPLAEVLTSFELIHFIRQIITTRTPREDEIVLSKNDDDKRYIQAHGTFLLDARAQNVGALIVLYDVTRLRGLENVRRDFVANVSHELKTPITAIKGFVETLQDGALASPADADRFIRIILKHTDRLNAIVDDLLTLSRLEQEDRQGEIPLAPEALQDILANVAETCASTAQTKNVTLQVNCPDGLQAMVNSPFLEQAVANLVVNAITYSHADRPIIISAKAASNEILITVKDFGIGIAPEHLSRLFERFYRSDKARSRKQGGTGLGLAIVKHIIQLHGGTISVQSTPGQGSVFTIHLKNA